MYFTAGKRKAIYIILFGLVIILHFAGIGKLSIYALDEAKNAVAAFEMFEKGDFIFPTFNDQPRYDKPPLHYYFFIVGYKIFGYTAFAARFFPALVGIFCVGICAKFVNEYFGHQSTFIFLLLAIANIHWMVQFHMAVPDPFLIAFLTTSYLYGFRYYHSNYQIVKYQYYSYILLGLAVLTKGPVAILLYVVTFTLFMLIQKRFNLRPWFRILPLFIFILISGSWYFLITWKTGGNWLGEFIFTHNLSRFSSPMEGHGGSFLKTLLFVILGLFPFILLLPSAAKGIFDRWKNKEVGVQNNFLNFAFLAAFVVVVFFCFASTRLPNYTTLAYPWLMVILAVFLAKTKSLITLKWLWGITFVFVLALSIGGYFGLSEIPYLSEKRSIAFSFTFAFIPLVCALVFIIQKKFMAAFSGVSIAFSSLSLLFFLWVMPTLDKENPVIITKPIWENQERIFHYKIFNPAFVFYLQRPIPALDKTSVKSGDLVITRKNSLDNLRSEGFEFEIIAEANDLFESPVTVIIRMNPPFQSREP